VGNLLRSSYLCYFSQPAHYRALYKAVHGRPIRSIVELGIGFDGRTERLIEVASWRTDCLPLRYTGIDLFEGRRLEHAAARSCPSLKQAFTTLRFPSVNVQLVPGEPDAALRRVANALTGTDLLVISIDQDEASLARAWTWMPRMLTHESLVFREERASQPGSKPQLAWRQVTLAEIQRLSATASRSRRAA
jgi:hypothetical protein